MARFHKLWKTLYFFSTFLFIASISSLHYDVNGVPDTLQDLNEDLAIFSTKIDELNLSEAIARGRHFESNFPSARIRRLHQARVIYYSNSCATHNVKYLLMCGDVQANPGPCRNSTGRPYSDNHQTSENILRCISLNARSICNKLNEFHDLGKMRNVDIVAAAETWLHQRILDAEILDSNYITFRRDRPTRSANDNSTILDLLITSVPEFVRNITILSGEFSSEHTLITFEIIILLKCIKPLKRYVYNYKDADFDGLRELLNYIPWDVVYEENDTYFSTVKWVDLSFAAVNDCVPKIEIIVLHGLMLKFLKLLERKRDLESGPKSDPPNITEQYFDCIVRNSNHLLNGSISNISKVCHQLWQKTLSDSGLIIKINTRIKEFQHIWNTTEWKSLMLKKRQNYSITTLIQYKREMIVFPFTRTIFQWLQSR